MSETIESGLVKPENPGTGGTVKLPEPQTPVVQPVVHLSPNQKAWRRFKRNRPAVIGAWFLITLVAIVIAWPMVLQIASKMGPKGVAFATQYDPNILSDASFQ